MLCSVLQGIDLSLVLLRSLDHGGIHIWMDACCLIVWRSTNGLKGLGLFLTLLLDAPPFALEPARTVAVHNLLSMQPWFSQLAIRVTGCYPPLMQTCQTTRADALVVFSHCDAFSMCVEALYVSWKLYVCGV